MKVNNKFNALTWTACTAALLLAACASNKFPETSTPNLDERFGTSLKAAKEAQKINHEPNQAETTAGSKELSQSYDNYIKGKQNTAPLQAPISSGGGQ